MQLDAVRYFDHLRRRAMMDTAQAEWEREQSGRADQEPAPVPFDDEDRAWLQAMKNMFSGQGKAE